MNREITVAQVALPVDKIIVLEATDIFRTAVVLMSEKHLGITCVVDPDGRLVGVFTDGDIRRVLLHEHKPIAALFSEDIGNYMIRNPKTVTGDMSLELAVSLMETADVFDLPVTDHSGYLTGLLHMHTALKNLISL